jgi:hypothetical protein
MVSTPRVAIRMTAFGCLSKSVILPRLSDRFREKQTLAERQQYFDGSWSGESEITVLR